MRLIKKSEPVSECVRKQRNLLTRLIGTSYCKDRLAYGNAHVHFNSELYMFIIGKKFDVLFGHTLYRGLTPLRIVDRNIYECAVDSLENIIVGDL